MGKSKVLRSTIIIRPYEKWNAMIDFLVNNEYEDMSHVQKIAYLCFWYDGEVQNGGHIQYFTNLKGEYYEETLQALEAIGAREQKYILQKCVEICNELNLDDIEGKNEFISEVLVGYDYRFKDRKKEELFSENSEECDTNYYKCDPSVSDLLELYLEANENQFLEIIED